MARFGDRSYRFETAGHWRAGAIRGFAATSKGLTLAQPLAAQRIEQSEAGALAALAPCDRLVWLCPATGELVALHTFGAEPQGRIAAPAPEAIHVGPAIVWVRGDGRLHRYAARGLQELGEIEVGDLVASASDGCDGLWLLTQSEKGATLRWLDPAGRFRQPPIDLPAVAAARALACDPARRRLAVVDGREGEGAWRLHLVDLARCAAGPAFGFPLAPGDPPPAWIAVDGDGGFRLAPAGLPGHLLAVSEDGIETARQILALKEPAALAGLLWRDGLVLCAADGLYRLVPAAGDEAEPVPAGAAFITPTLRSPPGTPSGWNRAEMKVDLPRGARLTATIFTSSSSSIAESFDALLADPAIPPALRIGAIEKLLRSPDVDRSRPGQHYKGEGEQPIHLLLDGIAAPYLWLRLDLECPAGAGPASLRRLRIRYPDRSWLDELPAIYRDEPGPAAQLRRFLAPFEALYTELDEAIDRLPAQIDPDTAPAERLPWLLGWLGFPPTAGLPAPVQRELLKAAGGLLERRGTIAALREMLRIVTGNPVTVEDSAAANGFWVIGTGPARLAPRLGRSTRVAERRPGGFRPGTGIRLGEEPLPPFCTDIGRLLRARCGLVTIRIAIDPAKREMVLPIVESLLAMFVPAHCRIDLRLAPAGRTRPGGRLDRGWRLAGDDGVEGEGSARLDDPDGIELASETEIGGWQLPSPAPPYFTVDGRAALDGVRRLA